MGTCAEPPAGTIPCNGSLCQPGVEYCEIQYSDTPSPDSIVCRSLPEACHGRADCSCVTRGWCFGCEVNANGEVVLHCPGG